MRGKRTEDLNSALDALDAQEERRSRSSGSDSAQQRTRVGTIDRFFNNLGVAAIRLTDDLKIGDTIEIENEEYTVRQKVSSMQINRKDIEKASAGEDVGVKTSVPVRSKSVVYKMK